MVGIFPSEQSIWRLIGAMLVEANDEWQLQHRYMQAEGMAELATPPIEIEGELTPDHVTRVAPPGRMTRGHLSHTAFFTTLTGTTSHGAGEHALSMLSVRGGP